MKLIKALSFGILAATLLTTPVALIKAADAVDDDRRSAKFEQLDLSKAQASQIEAIRTRTRRANRDGADARAADGIRK